MKIHNSEIFIIPVGHKELNMIYSPLGNTCYQVDETMTKQIMKAIYKKNLCRNKIIGEMTTKLLNYQLPESLRQSPDEYKTLSLLPNHICNFRCKYCYSKQGRSHTIINRKKLQTALDFFINPDRIAPQTLKLFISGGGEPLLTWEDTLYAIVYAQERAQQYGFTLWTSIITNGSIVNEEIIETLLKYKSSVCISFEVLEDLQNSLRGNYNLVSETLTKYGQAGVPVMLNSTITPASVSHMKEMVHKVVSDYPFVRNYTLEPVTDHTLFDSPEMLRNFYTQFSNNYFELKKEVEPNTIWCSLDEMIDTKKLRYCPGKLCLTPHGTFSVCHCVSAMDEQRYEKCVYGRITEQSVVFDLEKFKQLMDINAQYYSKCSDCFAKWNCGGECMTRQDQYPENFMDEVCNFNRQWLTMQLKERHGYFTEK